MSSSTLDQVLEFVPDGQRFVQGSFRMDEGTAADVVQDVLHRLLRDGPDLLEQPKRYFLRACRWRALQVLRERGRRRRAYEVLREREKAKEVLVALEEEDKPKFFGQVSPKQREVLVLLSEGHSQEEISAMLAIPSSTVRMRLHHTRRRFFYCL